MSQPRRLHAAILIVLCTLLTTCVMAAPAVDTSGKIAPRVMTETANGGLTEALVVLSEQADLSAAASLPTKLEKGRYVVDALRAVANRTQGPLKTFLDQRGISYQSFYIVNM